MPTWAQPGDIEVRHLADLRGDHRRRFLGEAAVEREHHLSAIRDRPRIGAGASQARGRQPRVGQVLGELAQPRPAERRLPRLRRQERPDAALWGTLGSLGLTPSEAAIVADVLWAAR
jgi:hypothetical protein